MANRVYIFTSAVDSDNDSLSQYDESGVVSAVDYNILVNRLNDLLLKLQQFGVNIED